MGLPKQKMRITVPVKLDFYVTYFESEGHIDDIKIKDVSIAETEEEIIEQIIENKEIYLAISNKRSMQ